MMLATAFAQSQYLATKASSTIGAAITAGVPLLISDEALQVYSYAASPVASYVYAGGCDQAMNGTSCPGTDMESVLLNALRTLTSQQASKAVAVAELRIQLLRHNAAVFGRLLQ